jgi:predicted PurR-regulated permease PerM
MARATRIEIPRWIQLVGLPPLLLLAWALAGALRHAVFVFLVAGLVALLLDPLVRTVEHVPLGRFRIPRGLAVAGVYLGFAGAVALAIVGLATVVVDQTRAASDRVEAYLTIERGRNDQTDAERDIDRLQTWLDGHGLERVQIEEQADEFLSGPSANEIGDYTSKALDVVEGAAISLVTLLFSLVLVVVISTYGVLGALVALPLLAVARALWEFFARRVELEPWGEQEPAASEVEAVEQPPAAAAR